MHSYTKKPWNELTDQNFKKMKDFQMKNLPNGRRIHRRTKLYTCQQDLMIFQQDQVQAIFDKIILNDNKRCGIQQKAAGNSKIRRGQP